MINQILGWLTLTIIFFTIIKYTKNDLSLKRVLIFSFLLRFLLLLINQYVFPLPGSTFDAKTFEIQAWQYSQTYGFSIFYNLFQNDVYLISRIISIFYTLTSRSEMMAQGFSLGLGTASIYLVYRLSLMIWCKETSIKISWFASIYPPMVLYSVLVLREAYVNFFLLLTLIACVSFIKNLYKDKKYSIKVNQNIKLLIFIVGGFFILKYFHGGIFTGFFVFLIFIGYCFFQREFKNLKKGIIKFKIIVIFTFTITPFILWYLGILNIPYVPGIEEAQRLDEVLLRRFRLGSVSAVHGAFGAAYPQWTIPTNNFEFIPKLFARIIYFLYSPFPWDLKRFVHSIGFIDTIFLFYFTICAFQNRRAIWQNRELRFLLFVLIAFIVTYGIGTNNFGTAIRHKSKFIFILVCIAGPKLKKLAFR